MTPVGALLYYALWIYFLLLIFRLIMEWVFVFARNYRPSGLVAMALELAYSATDPPLRALRRVLPPLRIGAVAIDLAFLLLLIVVQILISIAASL
jgi:YggT family protein